MTTLTLEKEPTARRVETTETRLIIYLDDGRDVSAPLPWFPRLAFGTVDERANCHLFAGGTAIEWPELDEHIRIETLLAGQRSAESEAHLKRWKKAMQRRRREKAKGQSPEPWGVGSYRPPYGITDDPDDE